MKRSLTQADFTLLMYGAYQETKTLLRLLSPIIEILPCRRPQLSNPSAELNDNCLTPKKTIL